MKFNFTNMFLLMVSTTDGFLLKENLWIKLKIRVMAGRPSNLKDLDSSKNVIKLLVETHKKLASNYQKGFITVKAIKIFTLIIEKTINNFGHIFK